MLAMEEIAAFGRARVGFCIKKSNRAHMENWWILLMIEVNPLESSRMLEIKGKDLSLKAGNDL